MDTIDEKSNEDIKLKKVSKQESLINYQQLSNIKGLNGGDRFYLSKKYKLDDLKTIEDWVNLLKNKINIQ